MHTMQNVTFKARTCMKCFKIHKEGDKRVCARNIKMLEKILEQEVAFVEVVEELDHPSAPKPKCVVCDEPMGLVCQPCLAKLAKSRSSKDRLVAQSLLSLAKALHATGNRITFGEPPIG